MTTSTKVTFALLIASLAFSACRYDEAGRDGEGRWLQGTVGERFEQVEEQFGGFSQAMWEAGYRYSELYWAGVDENWAYAEYQIEHLREAIEKGLERRPERAEGAHAFMTTDLPAMEEAVEAKDSANFRQQFEGFTISCNACHVREDVAFIHVRPPADRTGATGPEDGSAARD